MCDFICHLSFPFFDVLDVQLVGNNPLLVGFLKLALFSHLLLHPTSLNILC